MAAHSSTAQPFITQLFQESTVSSSVLPSLCSPKRSESTTDRKTESADQVQTMKQAGPSPALSRRSSLLAGIASTSIHRLAAPDAATAAPSTASPAPSTWPPLLLGRFAEPGPFAVSIKPLQLQLDQLQVDLPPGVAPAAVLRLPAETAAAANPSSSAGAPPPPAAAAAAAAATAGGSTDTLLPLVVFSPGFLVPSAQYTSYLDHLASWGYPVVSYDPAPTLPSIPDASSTLTDAQAVALLGAAVSSGLAALKGPQRQGGSSSSSSSRGVYLIGHSRGAKLSVQAAAALSRAAAAGPADRRRTVATLGLIDPVDFDPSVQGQPDEGGGSALPDLAALVQAGVPVTILGAGRNADCVPRRISYREFAQTCRADSSTRGGSFLAVAHDAGHLQFLDSQTTLQR